MMEEAPDLNIPMRTEVEEIARNREPQHMTAMLSSYNSKSVKDNKKGRERSAGDPTTVAGCRIDWKVANLIVVVSIHL
jgi:hypothetical protein